MFNEEPKLDPRLEDLLRKMLSIHEKERISWNDGNFNNFKSDIN
jgi:hypothetical protein